VSVIENIKAREILDSRGNPTVEVDVTLASGAFGRAAVPSGASTGSREAIEKRDGDKTRYLGKGVLQAVDVVNTTLKSALKGQDALDQKAIDDLIINLDGTDNKVNFGANALLGVSLAVAKAAAAEKNLPLYKYVGELYGNDKFTLPTPMMNVINGGEHANNRLDIQEFMVIPVGAKSIADAVRMGAEIFHHLKKLLVAAGHNTAVGDEGGFAPNLSSNAEAFDWLTQAVESAGYKLGEEIVFAIDAAASEFYKGDQMRQSKSYVLAGEGRKLTSEELVDYYAELCDKYPIVSIEDGMAEDDAQGWELLTAKLSDKIQIVGDDLFVTNCSIFKKGIENGIANSILIKVNQIGTLTETLDTMRLADQNHYANVVSHRSGETEDCTISDIAVGTGCGQIKTGSLSRSDRTAKYNQLIRIDEELSGGVYAGKSKIAGHQKLGA